MTVPAAAVSASLGADGGRFSHGARSRTDPLAAVLALGLRASRIGLVAGSVLALLVHGAAVGGPAMSLLGMRQQVVWMRAELHRYFWSEYDVSLVDAPEPATTEAETEPEPAAEPEPTDPEPTAAPMDTATAPEAPDDPYQEDEPPPAPAEAADILDAPDDAVDLTGTGWSMVDKDGSTKTGGGYTSAEGTAANAVHNPAAKVGGTPGGKGTGKPRPHAKAKSQARSATLLGGRSWSCPFPAQADVEQVDRATAVVAVTVGPDGRARAARVLSDPGYGFGQAARRCALSRTYRPALDARGRAISSTTPPIRVRFRR